MGDLEKLGGPLGWRALPIANVWLRHWALVKKMQRFPHRTAPLRQQIPSGTSTCPGLVSALVF